MRLRRLGASLGAGPRDIGFGKWQRGLPEHRTITELLGRCD
jgi:hypothetical protein